MSSAWPSLPFPEVLTDVSAGNIRTPARDFQPQGTYPLVDQGQALVAGFSDDPSVLCKTELPVVVFGDHTRALKYIDFRFGIGADGVKVLRPLIDVELKYVYWYLKSAMFESAGYDRHYKYLKRLHIPLAPIEEQRRIAAILDKADEVRAKRREALETLETLTEAIFMEMFGNPFTPRADTRRLGEVARLPWDNLPLVRHIIIWALVLLCSTDHQNSEDDILLQCSGLHHRLEFAPRMTYFFVSEGRRQVALI